MASKPADEANPMLQLANAVAALLEHQTRIAESHELGVGPGTAPDVLSPEWNETAAQIIADTVPSEWLHHAQVVATRVLELMAAHDPPESLRADWDVVRSFYEILSTQFAGYIDDADREFQVDMNLAGSPWAVIRYDKLAAGIHPEATARMVSAAAHVKSYSLQAAYGVTDFELDWLRALSTGERGLDVGTRFGFSERAFYRAQQQLCTKLGVDTRSEAFVRASELGWL